MQHDDRFWAELRSLLLRSVPHRLSARDAQGAVQDTLLRLGSKPDPCGDLDPCHQGNGKQCPAQCRILWLGKKILHDVARDRLRRLRRERRSGVDPAQRESVVPRVRNHEPDSDGNPWQTFSEDLAYILAWHEPALSQDQAKVARLIVGNPDTWSIEALADATGRDLEALQELLHRLGNRIEALRPSGNQRICKRLGR